LDKSYQAAASALFSLDFEVVPVYADRKVVNGQLCPHGAKEHYGPASSADRDLTAALHGREFPDGNIGTVGTKDTAAFIDDDGIEIPESIRNILNTHYHTLTASGKHHYAIRQDDETRSWGNFAVKGKDQNGETHEIFSFRGDNEYVVAPPSVINGVAYSFVNKIRPRTLDESKSDDKALKAWLRGLYERRAKRTASADVRTSDTRRYHKDFTPEKFFDHYGWKFTKDGNRYHVHFPDQGCPVAQRVHKVDGSTQPRAIQQCTFTFEPGKLPTFSCLSGGCEEKSFKDAHSALIKANPKLKPFKIWEKDDEERRFVEVVRGRDVVREHLAWLWPDFLPDNKLVHFGGVSAAGKSPVTMSLSGIVTAGKNWPDGAKNEHGPRSVLMMNMEDSLEDTIMPRLDLEGGNDNKFFFVKGTRCEKGEKNCLLALALDRDMNELFEAARKIEDLSLVVCDPITNDLGRKKMNSEEEVRSVLTPCAQLAAELKVTFITVGHLNRREAGTNPLHRMMGAAAFVGVARQIFLFGEDPWSEDKYSHVMVSARSASGSGDGIKYQTYMGKSTYKDQEFDAVGVRWGEKSTAEATDVVDPTSRAEKGKVAEAAAALRQILAKGALPARECVNALTNLGFDVTKLDPSRIRARAGVRTTKEGKNSRWQIATGIEQQNDFVEAVQEEWKHQENQDSEPDVPF
jgi:hypothetical protein